MSTQQEHQRQQGPPLVPHQTHSEQQQRRRRQQQQRQRMQRQDQRTLCEQMVRRVLASTTEALMSNEDGFMTDDEQRQLEDVVEACPLNEHARVWADALAAMGPEALRRLHVDYQTHTSRDTTYNVLRLATNDRGSLIVPPQIVVENFRQVDDPQAHFRNVVQLLTTDPEVLFRLAYEPVRTLVRVRRREITNLINTATRVDRSWSGANVRVVGQVLLQILRLFYDDRANTADLKRFKLFRCDDALFFIRNDRLDSHDVAHLEM